MSVVLKLLFHTGEGNPNFYLNKSSHVYDYMYRSAFRDILVFSHSKYQTRISSHVSFLLLFLHVRVLFLDEPK